MIRALCFPFPSANGKEVRVLAEQVTDCGPLIDLERTPTCSMIPLSDEEKEEEFPGCCPKYECTEGTKIFYEGQEAVEEEPRTSN